jgi:hypothetical protein
MNNPISNTVFDSRDLIEYKEQLEQEVKDYFQEYCEEQDNIEWDDYSDHDIEDIKALDNTEEFLEFFDTYENELQEYKDIEEFCDELEAQCSDFHHGESIIHERYFVEYCEETLIDCGYIPKDMPSWIEIDMEATAENMKSDYAEVEFDGETYFIRGY